MERASILGRVPWRMLLRISSPVLKTMIAADMKALGGQARGSPHDASAAIFEVKRPSGLGERIG
jgi:hypothetical protein